MTKARRSNTQRNIALSVLLLTVVASAGWYFFSQQPALNEIARLETDLRAVDTELSRAQQVARTLPELRQTVNSLEQSRVEFLQQLPSTRDVADLIDTLHVAAARSAVTLSTINQSGGQGGVSGVTPIGFSLSASGTWANMLFFLNHLENLQHFTKIHNVSFSGGGGDSADPELSVSFTLSVYTLTEAGRAL